MEIKFTKTERLLLANQFKILAMVETDSKPDYDLKAEILESGFTSQYSTIFSSIGEELSYENCNETQDILSMFWKIEEQMEFLQPDDLSHEEKDLLTFQGFDGNNDPQYFFMEFLIEKLNKYKSLAEKHLDRNSHNSMMIERYRRMLDYVEKRRNEVGGRFNYDLGTLREIASAASY